MKKLLCVAVVCLAATYAQAQTRMNCCSPSATDLFAMNVTDNAFILSHAEPLPFTYATERGKDISYKAADGTDAHAFEIKAVNATPYYLFVIHEWWGLNDYIKQEAEKLSNELGINVIALDLYDQKVASTREDAGTVCFVGCYCSNIYTPMVSTCVWCLRDGLHIFPLFLRWFYG